MGPFVRDMHDGAGLCSPGRWPPERRAAVKAWTIGALGAAFRREVARFPLTAGRGAEAIFDSLARGHVEASPFPQEATSSLLQYASDLLADEGRPGAELSQEGDRAQPIRIRLLEALLTPAGDPDLNCWRLFARGVPTGVRDRLPRTPAVYGRK